MKLTTKQESKPGIYLIGLGILMMLSLIALSFLTANEAAAGDSYIEGYNGGLIYAAEHQQSCDLNITNNLIGYGIVQDINQHTQLAQLIVESNYRMGCIIDQNTLQQVELPQGNGTYTKAIKATWYCPTAQGGG